MSKLARAGSWFEAKLCRMWARPLTIGRLVGSICTAVAFGIVTLAPAWRAAPSTNLTFSEKFSQVLAFSWPAVIAAVYLKYADRVKSVKSLDKVSQRRRNKRQIHVAGALAKLRESFDPKILSNEFDVRAYREQILEAAAASVEELLGYSAAEETCANLMVFSDASLMSMRVTCRSQKQRGDDKPRPREGLVAFAAIKARRTEKVDDITTDPRGHSHLNAKYKSILALPISTRNVSIGCLTIDSERAFDFYARSNEIAVQLAPYAMTLALTFPDEGFYYEHKDGSGND